MDYQRNYDALISKGHNRPREEGMVYERHHILPRSLGGTDGPENLVLLTPREHFIAHLLLAKMHGGKMTYALYLMSSKRSYTARTYSHLKTQFCNALKDNHERAERISTALTGKAKSAEHVDNWKQSRATGRGWVVSEQHRKSLSDRQSGCKNVMYGKTHSDDAVRKIKAANAQKVQCPHCGKTGGVAIMPRWHMDRCKQKPDG